jgi:hypothetical protein
MYQSFWNFPRIGVNRVVAVQTQLSELQNTRVFLEEARGLSKNIPTIAGRSWRRGKARFSRKWTAR